LIDAGIQYPHPMRVLRRFATRQILWYSALAHEACKGGKPMKCKVGSRVVAKVDIEVIPWDLEDGVAAGDHGKVIDVDSETGDLTILMDRLIPSLIYRQNYLFVRAEHIGGRLRKE
jgi:hypothetical protein